MPQASRIYKILGKFNQPLERITVNGLSTGSPKETLEVLQDTHFPGGVESHFWDLRPQEESYVQSNVTIESTIDAINQFQPFRSAGPDGFPPFVLQLGGRWIAEALCAIYRASLTIGYIPLEWRESKVVFIPKPGKSDYESPSSWRPISFMCFTLKALERIVDKMIRTTDLIHSLRQNHQFAYIEGGSTEAALHRLVGYLERNMSAKRRSLVAFIDVEGAFSNVSREGIMEGMRHLQINPTISRWVDHFLQHRILKSTIKGYSASKCVSNGCPQGSCCSPIYWNIALNGLLQKLRERFPSLLIQAYADDICIAATGICPFTLRDQIRRALLTIRSWCLERGLALNVDKTELLWVDTSRKVIQPPISIDGRIVKVKAAVRYIGIWIDRRLNSNTHVRNKSDACIKKLVMCQRAIGKFWGIHPRLAMWL